MKLLSIIEATAILAFGQFVDASPLASGQTAKLASSSDWTVSSSIQWNNFGQLRVYGSKPDGTIVEWAFNGDYWSGPKALPGTATPQTPIAAVSYQDSTGGTHIRLHYHDIGGRAKELVYEGGWTTGATLP